MTIVVERVSHRFQALEVLADVSFEVGDNEIFAVVGPSGCGKSTLLSIIGGFSSRAPAMFASAASRQMR